MARQDRTLQRKRTTGSKLYTDTVKHATLMQGFFTCPETATRDHTVECNRGTNPYAFYATALHALHTFCMHDVISSAHIHSSHDSSQDTQHNTRCTEHLSSAQYAMCQVWTRCVHVQQRAEGTRHDTWETKNEPLAGQEAVSVWRLVAPW